MNSDERSKVFKHPARLFDRNLVVNNDNIAVIRRTVFNSIPIFSSQSYVLDRYKRCIDVILANLYIATRVKKYLMIPLDCNYRYKYPVCKENDNIYSLKRIREILNAMESLKLVRVYKGFKAEQGFKTGKITRIVQTRLLVNKFYSFDYISFDKGSLENHPIILRDKNKKCIEFKDILPGDRRLINDLKEDVIRLNKMYKKTNISCHIPINILNDRLGEKLKDLLVRCHIAKQINILTDNKIYNPLLPSMNNNYEYNQDIGININNNNIYKYIYLIYRSYTVKPFNYLELLKKLGYRDYVNFLIMSKTVYRIFTVDFKTHGRFYGPTYQRISKQFRKYINIDGEKTVELDFNAMHIRMLYHAMKIDYQDDPYITPSGKGREYMKKVALIAINSNDRQQCIRAICNAFNNMGKTINWNGVETLLDLFIENNKPIRSALYSGTWKSLTFTDSLIMNNILVELMNQKIVGLPIHDSIIVKKKHKSILKQIMIEKYREQFGFDPII